MTSTNLYGRGAGDIDISTLSASAPAYSTAGVIDASTELFSVVGRLWKPSRPGAAFNIRKIHWRNGAVTFGGGNARVSLQDVSATAGPPYQPDGTPDQTATLTAFSANAWNTSGNLSADRSCTVGQLLAAVWDYGAAGAGFTAGDSIVFSCMSMGTANIFPLLGGAALLNTGSWAVVSNNAGIIVFECDDGTFAYFEDTLPWSALGTVSIATGATARAAGVRFQVSVPTKIESFSLFMAIPNNCDGTLRLLDSDGSTVLASAAIDNDPVISTAARWAKAVFDPVTLNAATDYYAIFEPGTATGATLHYGDVNTAAFLDCTPGGQQAYYVERDAGGTWTPTTTRKPHWGFRMSAFDDGAGGGGFARTMAVRL